MVTSQPNLPLPEAADGDVGAALELLRDSLHAEELRIRTDGAKAMEAGDLDTATQVIEFARRQQAFIGKVEALGGERQGLEGLRDQSTPEVQQIVTKRFFGRKRSGEITQQSEYHRALLETLVERGREAELPTPEARLPTGWEGVGTPDARPAGREWGFPRPVGSRESGVETRKKP